ncbi:hypothetical protein AV530_012489 [Patagioenas fasciata monilis]|uniref:Uncharacterized protein n=1 Tax=Patagioenas fasciata monilis TaxID=372326 RepID=A0A1V4JBM6_PATFA|nr:hypothetical protein AV530_012489 [Patagioenas fasciata monilis]
MVGRLQLNILCHYNEECINFISEALSETAFIHFFLLLFIKLPSFSALKSYTALLTINLRALHRSGTGIPSTDPFICEKLKNKIW